MTDTDPDLRSWNWLIGDIGSWFRNSVAKLLPPASGFPANGNKIREEFAEWDTAQGVMLDALAAWEEHPTPTNKQLLIASQDLHDKELADVFISLVVYADLAQVDLYHVVSIKHSVNRGRRWVWDPVAKVLRHVRAEQA